MKADDFLITNNDPERFDFSFTLYWDFKTTTSKETSRINGELSICKNARLIRTFKNKFKLDMGEYEVTRREPKKFKSFQTLAQLKRYSKEYLNVEL